MGMTNTVTAGNPFPAGFGWGPTYPCYPYLPVYGPYQPYATVPPLYPPSITPTIYPMPPLTPMYDAVVDQAAIDCAIALLESRSYKVTPPEIKEV